MATHPRFLSSAAFPAAAPQNGARASARSLTAADRCGCPADVGLLRAARSALFLCAAAPHPGQQPLCVPSDPAPVATASAQGGHRRRLRPVERARLRPVVQAGAQAGDDDRHRVQAELVRGQDNLRGARDRAGASCHWPRRPRLGGLRGLRGGGFRGRPEGVWPADGAEDAAPAGPGPPAARDIPAAGGCAASPAHRPDES